MNAATKIYFPLLSAVLAFGGPKRFREGTPARKHKRVKPARARTIRAAMRTLRIQGLAAA